MQMLMLDPRLILRPGKQLIWQRLGIDCGDVGNLSRNLLVLGADTAISIDHNITFLSVLNLTLVSFGAIIMPCIC